MRDLIRPVEIRCNPFIDTFGSAISGATNMSVAVLHSRALSGFDAPPVEVEVHLAGGLPAFNLVGLPETEVKESRDRVRAARVERSGSGAGSRCDRAPGKKPP